MLTVLRRFGHGHGCHRSELGFASVGEMGVEDEEVRPGTAMTGMLMLDVTSPDVTSPSRLQPLQN
jgi:hypothetical protein